MLKIFELIGRYFILMGKVFSPPEKRAVPPRARRSGPPTAVASSMKWSRWD